MREESTFWQCRDEESSYFDAIKQIGCRSNIYHVAGTFVFVVLTFCTGNSRPLQSNLREVIVLDPHSSATTLCTT